MDQRDLLPGRYDRAAERWVPDSPAEGASQQATLTVASLNVWFEPHFFTERCQKTLALLHIHRPDIIALQEATPAFRDHVLREGWVRREYRVSDIAASSIDPYGVLMLSRMPIRAWEIRPLPSAMGRALIIARTAVNGGETIFASVHLESTSQRATTRTKQLRQIFPQLAAAPHALLMGDFNFCSSSYENEQLDPAYQDVWPHLHPGDPGYTRDPAVNIMRAQHAGRHRPERIDRILLRSHTPGWQAEAIQLLGTKAIGATTPDIFPSDHFGLVARFRWQKETEGTPWT